MIYLLLSQTSNMAFKNTFQPTAFKSLRKFKELHRNLRPVQGKMEFKDFPQNSRTFQDYVRVVTKISSCRVNTTSRRGIKRLGISFGSIFLLFSNKSSRGPLSQQLGKIPGPRLLMTTLYVNLAYLQNQNKSGS